MHAGGALSSSAPSIAHMAIDTQPQAGKRAGPGTVIDTFSYMAANAQNLGVPGQPTSIAGSYPRYHDVDRKHAMADVPPPPCAAVDTPVKEAPMNFEEWFHRLGEEEQRAFKDKATDGSEGKVLDAMRMLHDDQANGEDTPSVFHLPFEVHNKIMAAKGAGVTLKRLKEILKEYLNSGDLFIAGKRKYTGKGGAPKEVYRLNPSAVTLISAWLAEVDAPKPKPHAPPKARQAKTKAQSNKRRSDEKDNNQNPKKPKPTKEGEEAEEASQAAIGAVPVVPVPGEGQGTGQEKPGEGGEQIQEVTNEQEQTRSVVEGMGQVEGVEQIQPVIQHVTHEHEERSGVVPGKGQREGDDALDESPDPNLFDGINSIHSFASSSTDNLE
jgi:hypothetical protein